MATAPAREVWSEADAKTAADRTNGYRKGDDGGSASRRAWAAVVHDPAGWPDLTISKGEGSEIAPGIGGLTQQRGVYFFDEFAALGAERGDRQNVGEIRRVLNSSLQFLEWDLSASLVLAATNHGALLDRGLFRRFDSVLFYAIPGAAIAAKVIMARLGFLDCSAVDWQEAAAHGSGLSHAELVLAREQPAKLSWRIVQWCASGIWRKCWSGCVLDPCGIEIKAPCSREQPCSA